MMVARVLSLRPVEDGDRFRLRRWLSEPHVVEWFGSRAAAEASLALAAESDAAIARMIVLDGEAIGYAHALDLDDPRLPPGCWQADVSRKRPSAKDLASASRRCHGKA